MLNEECGWKDGDRSAVGLEANEKILKRTWQEIEISLPFSPDLLYGSRPPVQAALRLAALGLDGALLRSKGILLI